MDRPETKACVAEPHLVGSKEFTDFSDVLLRRFEEVDQQISNLRERISTTSQRVDEKPSVMHGTITGGWQVALCAFDSRAYRVYHDKTEVRFDGLTEGMAKELAAVLNTASVVF
jgi:hypothetical protein